MRTRLTGGIAAAILLISSLVSAQSTPAGHWEGTCTLDGRQIGLALDLAKNAKAEWIASLGMPAENATGLIVTDLTVDGSSVKFTGVELMMGRFDLTLGADGKMKGTLSYPHASAPIEFTRTGEAKVDLIPASPAVSKELEGDWEGSLDMGTGGQPFRMAVHFRNQPDKTVLATLDSLDRGAMGVPLNAVVQAGQKVEFGIRVAQSSFRGTLNKEGTELSGQWILEDTSLPFTLRKK